MPAPETRFAVLLFTDIVDSAELKARHGVPAYSAALSRYQTHFERLARECLNLRTLQNRGDGYFAEAGSVAEAVRFALLFQEALRVEPWSDVCLTTRIGIHAGEISTLDAQDGTWIVGPAADLAARVTDLAVGGQIVLTRFPFDEARHFIREHPPVAGRTMPPLRWLAHGPYLMKGRDEPLDVFEVGADGLAPLAAPPDGAKARRAIRPGEEETLGWRPAVGLEIPGRTGWQLIERLGAGGFGEVWIGEHAKLHQRRAFKFCFDDERLRALKREVTLVRLLRSALGERDDIVHIHELKLDAPPFYLESDLAPHGNLLQWAERQGGLEKIPLSQRIALVAHTATALAAAHSIGVLHKDIKPTNILIFDGPGGEPRPRLVDFGIGTLADFTVLNQFGVTGAGFTRATIKHSTGTPTYSPPEHLAGRPYTIQGDIYGLGVLLYQLVTAKPLDPLAPGWERDIADALLREDIAVCVDGDPARRLSSAADLAERLLDLDARRSEIEQTQRLAAETAARAEAESAAEAARVRARRFRRLAAAFAVLALIGISGGAAALVGLGKAKSANQRARALLTEAAQSDCVRARELATQGHFPAALAHLARACQYVPAASTPAEQAITLATETRVVPADIVLAGHLAAVHSARFSPDGSRIVTASGDDTARIWDATSGKIITTLEGHHDSVQSAQFSPDGERVVTASFDNSAGVWNANSGELIRKLEGHTKEALNAQFSPDARRIVTTSEDGTARVWDAASGDPVSILKGHTGSMLSAQFSPDGERVVTTSLDNTARIWDAASGDLIKELEGHTNEVNSAQFSPDGERIVTASEDKTARIWDTTTDAVVPLDGHGQAVLTAQFSPDGLRVVTGSDDATARVWDAASGKLIVTLEGPEDSVISARFSPDGLRIVTGSADKTAHVWNALTGKVIATLTGHQGSVHSAEFSADGTRIVTAGDTNGRVWIAAFARPITVLAGNATSTPRGQFSMDGSRIVTVSGDATVFDESSGRYVGSTRTTILSETRPGDMDARVWETRFGRQLVTLSGRRNREGVDDVQTILPGAVIIPRREMHEERVVDARFSGNGSRVVTTSYDTTGRVWDVTSGQTTAILEGHEGPALSAQFSPDASRIVTASRDNTARIWDAVSGKQISLLEGHVKDVVSAEFSPDGSRIVTASDDSTARVWEASSGKSIATLEGHGEAVNIAHFSPNGVRIVTGSADQTARVWEASTGDVLAILDGHEGSVASAQFSPDGKRIVTASNETTARVWDASNGKLLARLEGHAGPVYCAAFSSDGKRIVTGSEDNTARVWDAASGKLIAILAGHADAIRCAQFSPDGSCIMTGSEDGTVRVWTMIATSASPPTWFPDFLRLLASRRLDESGELVSLTSEQQTKYRAELLAPFETERNRYMEIARWHLMTGFDKPLHPGAMVTMREAADALIAPNAERPQLERAYELWPAHPLVHLALARDEPNPLRAEFLRRFSLDHLLPSVPASERFAFRRRAAELLDQQSGQELRAAELRD